jgi:hypothetical protein
MTDTLTPAKALTNQTTGANANTWGDIADANFEAIDAALGQTTTLAITTNTTLSATEAQKVGYKFTGTPGAAKTVTWPTFYGPLIVWNAITDGSALTCGMSSGATVIVPAGQITSIFSNGVDFKSLRGDFASTTTAPANPTGTTSTTGVMMGLARTITPTCTGKIRFQISGVAQNTIGQGEIAISLRYGGSTAPANGDALQGTQIGGAPSMLFAAANFGSGFVTHGILTGQVLGTTIWFDLVVSAVNSGGTASVAQLTCEAMEIP